MKLTQHCESATLRWRKEVKIAAETTRSVWRLIVIVQSSVEDGISKFSCHLSLHIETFKQMHPVTLEMHYILDRQSLCLLPHNLLSGWVCIYYFLYSQSQTKERILLHFSIFYFAFSCVTLAASDFSEKLAWLCVSSYLEKDTVFMNHLVRSTSNKSEMCSEKEGTWCVSFFFICKQAVFKKHVWKNVNLQKVQPETFLKKSFVNFIFCRRALEIELLIKEVH